MLTAKDAKDISLTSKRDLEFIMVEIRRRALLGLTEAYICNNDLNPHVFEDTDHWQTIKKNLTELGYKVTVDIGTWIDTTTIIINWSEA